MMAELWGDIDRDIGNASRHFEMAIEGFADVNSASNARERHFRRAAFVHAMLAGYTSSESAMKRLTGLLDEALPMGPEWRRAPIDRLAVEVAGRRPAILTDERLLLAIDALRGFRHVAAHA